MTSKSHDWDTARRVQQAGTGPSRRHIQGSKIAKGLPRVNLQYSKIEKAKKNGPSGALKGGHFRNCQHFCRSWRGDPMEKKQIFEKKVSQCRKTERRGAFGIFKHPICCKISKKLKGDPLERKNFSKKRSHNAEKLKGGSFGIFKQPICCKISKKLKGGPFGEKKN